MSTKTTTSSDNQSNLNFDPGSMSLYKNLTGNAGNVLNQYMNNPFTNAFYQMGLQTSQKGAMQQGQNNIQAMLQNMKVSGLGGASGAGFQQAQLGKIGRSNASMLSQANLGNVMNAFQRQLGATGMGMAFQPLMTGEKSHGQQTQQTGGLGTWLPQLAGAAFGGLTGGLGGLFGGGGGAGSGLISPTMSSMAGGAPTMIPGMMGGINSMAINPFSAGMDPSSLFSGYSPTMPSFGG